MADDLYHMDQLGKGASHGFALGTWLEAVYTLVNEIKADLNTHVAQTPTAGHGSGSAVVSVTAASLTTLDN